MADRQTTRLQRTLSRFDIVFLIVSAVVGLEMLGSVSAEGPQTFTWLVVLIVIFVIPYALIFAETGSAFTGEGGVYLWVRRAFGRPVAAVASAFTWITQPVWVGGSMAFLNAEAARNHLVH
ncbi:MAG: APC family permease, partial [Propionibacterium sp.]|nr:APC family permease [Propionibacterium sp.]